MALVQGITLLLIMASGVLGNGLIIRVICSDVFIQTIGNKFAFSMALSDLGLCVLFMPFSLISLFRQEWLFGNNMCYVTAFLGEFFLRAPAITLPVVVFEKHLNIVHRNLKKLSRNGVLTVFFVLWLVAAVFSLPYPPRAVVYDEHVGNCVLTNSRDASFKAAVIFAVLEGLLFKVVLASSFVFSILKIFKRIQLRRRAAHPQKNLLNVDQLRLMADDYSACTSLIVVASYVILCLPYVITQLLSMFFNMIIPPSWQIMAYWFVFLNTALRPLIYGFRNQRSRNLVLRYYNRAKRNLVVYRCCVKLARRRRAYVISVDQNTTEQTEVEQLQIVDLYRSNVVIDNAASSTPLFTRRRILTMRTINTTTEETFLDLNCTPHESHTELKTEKGCCDMTALGARMIKSSDGDLCIQDIEAEEIDSITESPRESIESKYQELIP
jgi:hypothetical protein